MVYYSLNFMDRYAQRATLAIMILLYSAMRATSAFHSFSFFQRIERLELEARRLGGLSDEGPGAASTRKVLVSEVTGLRHAGEIKSYIDLLFLSLVILLCISKIVTE